MMEDKDGGDRRRGSGYHSLSLLTQPRGVVVSFSLSLSPSPPPIPPTISQPHSVSLPPSVETEGEGSVGELTMAVHFTVGVRILREIEAGGLGGGGWMGWGCNRWPLKS